MKHKIMTTFVTILIGTGLLANVYGFAENPFKDQPKPKQEETLVEATKDLQPLENGNQTEYKEEKSDLSELISKGNLKGAQDYAESVDESLLNSKEKEKVDLLKLFKKIDLEAESTSDLFNTEETLSSGIKNNIKSLYRSAKEQLLNEKPNIARDLLIQILYLDRRNFKAKRLLELALNLKTGDYKIENIENKYWNKSSIHYYGGNYDDALDDLNILIVMDQNNPAYFDRIGSNYYSMGEIKKAIEAWNTSLYLNPSNTQLADIISKAKELLEDQKKEQMKREEERKQRQEATDEISDEEMQIVGKPKTREQAASIALEWKSNGYTVVIEQEEDGKWAVLVPKSEINNKR